MRSPNLQYVNRYFTRFVMALGLCCPMLAGCNGEHSPYVILTRYYEATGGVEQWKAIRTIHSIYSLGYNEQPASGTIEKWWQSPNLVFRRVALVDGEMTSGFDGSVAWECVNNELSFDSSEETLALHRVDMAISKLEHLNPASTSFNVSYEGISIEGETPCLVVSVTDMSSNIGYKYYIDSSSYLCVRKDRHTKFDDVVIRYPNFTTSDGLVVPATILELNLSNQVTLEYHLQRYQIDSLPDPSLFDPPHIK